MVENKSRIKIKEIVNDNIRKAQEKYINDLKKKLTKSIKSYSFEIGMTVLKKKSRDSERKGCKLNAKWLGKYIITDIRGNCAKIKNSDDGKIRKCLINLSKLKPYLEFNKIVNKPINILKNLKDCLNKTYKIGPYIINKESILSIDSP